MKIATLFSGIGAPEQGAKRVYGDELELVFACEYDKFARQSFNANYEIHNDYFHNDVREMDGTQYQGKVDVLVGGSPCQAFSIAGLRNGTDDERGQLIYQYIRIVDEVKAPIIIYENVKGMLSIGGGSTIREFVQALRDIGYYCHYEVVNTKHYGVPQNRERIFLVGFLDHEMYHRFQFAPKQKLEKRLKDVLESEVDEKYYLKEQTINKFEFVNSSGNQIGKIGGENSKNNNSITNRIFGVEGISPTLTTASTGGNQETKILESGPHDNSHKIGAFRGRNPDNPQSRSAGLATEQMFEINENGTSNCLTSVQKDNLVLENQYRIRKLTPRECLRLQDFPDSFVQSVSDSQMYKQAGNSMSCNVLEMIFRQIEKAKQIEEGRLF